MARAVSLILAAAWLASGCGGPGDTQAEIPPDATDYTQIDTLTTSPAGKFTVGDVEHEHRCEVRIDGRSVSGRVRVEETTSPLEALMRAKAEVFAPFPDELWIEVSSYNRVAYHKHAVHMIVNVYVDEELVETYTYVDGPGIEEPTRWSFNLFEHTGGVKESVLVRATMDIILYQNTLVSAIDVDNPPEAPPEAHGTVLGNSLRIQFRE